MKNLLNTEELKQQQGLRFPQDRSDTHKNNISNSLKGRKKSKDHLENIKLAKTHTICRLYDKTPMTIRFYSHWASQFN